jgi:hypothetical protein
MLIYSHKYYTKYMRITKHYKDLDLSKSSSLYTELHHIIPKSLGGTNKKENLVRVPARVHFLLHWMLYRIYRTQGMAFAWNIMKCSTDKQHRLTSNSFKYIKEALSTVQKGRTMSDEQRAKISASKTGKKVSEAHRCAIINGLIGRTHSQETKDKIGAKHKGKSVSDISRAKMSTSKSGKTAHNKGSTLTAEQKDHLSKINTGNRHSDEARAKMSIARKGKPKSVEHKAAISAAHKERHRLKLAGLPTDP